MYGPLAVTLLTGQKRKNHIKAAWKQWVPLVMASTAASGPQATVTIDGAH